MKFNWGFVSDVIGGQKTTNYYIGWVHDLIIYQLINGELKRQGNVYVDEILLVLMSVWVHYVVV